MSVSFFGGAVSVDALDIPWISLVLGDDGFIAVVTGAVAVESLPLSIPPPPLPPNLDFPKPFILGAAVLDFPFIIPPPPNGPASAAAAPPSEPFAAR